MKIAVVFGIFVLMSFTHSRATIEYDCPSQYCQCRTLPTRFDAVQLFCQPPIIRKDIFSLSSIPRNYTTWLSISCTDDIFFSYLQDGDFSHLMHLEELQITNCVIPTIPKNAFTGLQVLRHLNITRADRSSIRTIPEPGFLDPLDSLKVLHIAAAKMENFSIGFLCNLQNLEYVEMALNHKTAINGLKCKTDVRKSPALQNVKFLNLNSNEMGDINVHFSKVVPNVETLGLANNKITNFSNNSFSQLKNLRNLYLEKNPIKTLAVHSFRDLNELQILNLEATEISRLDSQIFESTTKLALLILSHNKLSLSGPSELGAFPPSLLYVDLSFNKIANISNLFSFSPYLKFLNLGGNRIMQIPSHIFENHSLMQILNLTQNPLQSSGLFDDSLSGLNQLTTLDLSRCQVTVIPDKFFEESASLTQLYLSDNGLTHLPESLRSLIFLSILDLSSNKIQTIIIDDFSRMQSLSFLNMNDNDVKYIPNLFLNGNQNIQEIYIGNNRLEEIEGGSFKSLTNLRILDLSNNNLADNTFTLDSVPNLKKIDLTGNKLTSISKLIFPQSTEFLYLGFNYINRIEVDTFSQLPHLRFVNLKNNRLSTFSVESIRLPPALLQRPHLYLAGNVIRCNCHMPWILKINENSNGHLPIVPDLSLLRCDLGNRFPEVRWLVDMDSDEFLCEWDTDCDILCHCCYKEICSCSYVCPTGCSCLRDVSKTLQIVDCGSKNLTRVPALPRIATHVYLDGNNIAEIPARTFSRISHLRILSLNNSKITHIQAGAFKGLTLLHSLWLDNNNLSDINAGTLSGLDNLINITLHSNSLASVELHSPEPTIQGQNISDFLSKMTNLTALTLSANPWSCDCSFGPDFQKWIWTNANIITDRNLVKCDPVFDEPDSQENVTHPENNRNETHEKLMHRDFSVCYPNSSRIVHKPYENKRTIVAMSVSGCIFVIVLAVALLLYISRQVIKVCLFNRYGLRFNRANEAKDGKRFDAFVSYSQADQKFVTKALVPKLEQEKPHYQLCLHYRDWPVGGSIAQTICESVEQSRRTIILLSSNFVNSEWCQYEFKAAHYRVLQDKAIRLIIILLDDTPPSNLDPELKLYIKTHTYLKWKDPWFWEKLRYALPDVQREARPSGAAYFRYQAGKGALPGPERGEIPDSSSSSSSDGESADEQEELARDTDQEDFRDVSGGRESETETFEHHDQDFI